MTLHRAGFFREEYGDDPGAPSIHDPREVELGDDKPHVLAYLEAGTLYAVSPGPMVDYFQQPKRHYIGSLTLHTDGVWVWPADLPYYLRHYDVAIPAAFVDHMRRHSWRPRTLTRDELIALIPREARE